MTSVGKLFQAAAARYENTDWLPVSRHLGRCKHAPTDERISGRDTAERHWNGARMQDGVSASYTALCTIIGLLGFIRLPHHLLNPSPPEGLERRSDVLAAPGALTIRSAELSSF